MRWLTLACTGAGLVAHTAFVAVHPLPLQTSFGSLIFLAWILAVFCLYGSIHHRRLAWGLFVLPLVLGLLALAEVFPEGRGDKTGSSSSSEKPSDAAWERVLTNLLRSPRYGEQMARHWMDVARYADTAGFANDFDRPGAWRYRDYLVRSFNRDTPFDRFIKEQIAGDELAPEDPNALLATSLLLTILSQSDRAISEALGGRATSRPGDAAARFS